MKDSYGDKTSRIWLIGDSPPEKWKDLLRYPLDSHHPAVHNIWTPVLAKINECLFDYGLRLNDRALYMRNAVASATDWGLTYEERDAKNSLRPELEEYKPTVVITFGDRAYSMTRYIRTGEKGYPITENRSHTLGAIFHSAILSFNTESINVLPLLHVSVSRGRFLEGQSSFCLMDIETYKDNEKHDYFAYAGYMIASVLKHEYFIANSPKLFLHNGTTAASERRLYQKPTLN
jgi:hypothetical protein